MRKIAGLLSILALLFAAVPGFAASKKVLKSTLKGSRVVGPIKLLGPDHYSFAKYKAQNHLPTALQNLISKQQQGPQYHNCTGLITLPCFNSWFITGYRNSVYSYSMLGHSPQAGGNSTLPNVLIPLEVQLIGPDNVTVLYDFDPKAPQDLGLSDASIAAQGPMWNSASYPGGGGLAPDTGQFTDTTIRASFNGVKASNWHVTLGTPMAPKNPYAAQLFFNNGDWACINGELPPCTSFPVVSIDTMSNIFEQILGPANENSPSTELPIILTDYVTAFIGFSQNCCVLGFHAAQQGKEGPNAVLVWTWATWIPQSVQNPFGQFGLDTFVLTHEVSELYHDPFVQTTGTLISPWVDGSAQFGQGNLETGDAIEAMNAADSIFTLNLNTTGGMYTYHEQNEALLPWFTRNPKAPQQGPGPGVYSWPNTNTLNNGHPCPSQDFVYGEGPAGFVFDDGSPTGQCH